MARLGSGFRGAAGGAGVGFAVGGPVGAAIGGGLGLITGLFDDDPEEERQARMMRLLERIRGLRTDALNRYEQTISKETAGAAAGARQAASRRAAAMGREGDVESIVAPIEQNIFREAAGLRARGVRDIGQQFDSAEMQAEFGFADRPIDPSVSDYLMEIGGTAANFKLGMDALDAQTNFNNNYLKALRGDEITQSTQNAAGEYLGSGYGAVNSRQFNPPTTVMKRDVPSLYRGFYNVYDTAGKHYGKATGR